MTRKELRDVLDEAAGDPPRVDLAEAAWARGVGMRRRRRAVFAGGGTLLAAAAVVGAMVISGGIAPDEDMAPAVPTSSPGPTETEQTPTEQTQEDPGPVSTESAVTFMFHRAGTNPTIETSSMQSLDSIAVPSQANLTGTTWDLVPIGNAAEASDFLDLTFGDEDTIGVEAPTTLNFRDRGGDTLLSMATGCAGPSFQEDLELGADGHFAGQPAVSLAIGCDGPDSGGFWGPALERGGWLHQPHEDVLLLSVLPDGLTIDAPTTDGPTSDGPTTDGPGTEVPTTDGPTTEEPTTEDPGDSAPAGPAASIGGGHGVVVPDGWTAVPLMRDSDTMAGTTCLLAAGETELLYPSCSAGVEIRTGVDPEASTPGGSWWDPGDPEDLAPPEYCYAAHLDYANAFDNEATFEEPETGTATVGGHDAEWFRWPASCADGQEFVAEAWRITDLGIELRSKDGSQDVEPLVQAVVLDRDVPTESQVEVMVSEPVGDVLTGELQEWAGRYEGTGEQVTYEITEDTRCLVTTSDGEPGTDMELGACTELQDDPDQYPVFRLIVTADDEVVSAHVVSGF